jgi:pimeloyl-ACP methyl ester carboxylesterase
MRRLLVLAAALVVGAAVLTAVPAQAQTPRLSWHPCEDTPDDPTTSCATLTLPIDWTHPHGATFGLALAKRAATDQAHKVGPLLVNPGGPGGSGVNFVLQGSDYFSADVRARFDLVGFDPRGVGRSNPVVCSMDLLDAQPFPVPATPAEYDALLAYNKQLGQDCRAHTGPLFDHVDTLSVVRDVDAIRAALGVRQISYYGVSYGTLIGQQYAEMFPGHYRALVIDSNMDHRLGTRAFLDTEAATDEDSFNEFVAWCNRDATCALHGQDVPAIWDELMRRADAGTLRNPDTGEAVTWFDLTDFAVGSFYDPDWAGLAQTLAAVYQQQPAGVARLAAAARPQAAGDLGRFPIAVFCEDWSLPLGGFDQLRASFAETNRIATHLRTSSLGWLVTVVCQGFPAKVNNPQRALHVRTGTPLLEINSVHDPATPYAWAADDARMLGPAGRFVTYQGWGHGAYGHTDCTVGYVDRYLIGQQLPPRGASCAAVPPPDQVAPKALRRDNTAPPTV